ncbi:MAG: hypothetical protein IJ461_08665 [Clostridia bacterium]|nr:hypothetical protein [Clostridia bacterium]
MQQGHTSKLRGRYLFFITVVLLLFAYLVYGLANLQLRSGDQYSQSAESQRTKTIPLRGSRGTITDADSVILAQDEQIYNVTFYKDGSTRKSDYPAYTTSINEAIDIIEKYDGELSVSFVIRRNEETGEWEFNFGSGVSESVLETRENQWRSNFYISNRNNYPTAESCLNYLKDLFSIPEDMTEERMLQVMAVYSEMQMNAFNSQPIVIAEEVKYETVIEIEARSMVLSGMEIAVGTKRVYPRGNLAAQVIGYTGAITSNTYYNEVLKPKGYAYNDVIGQDGIEASMEDWLTQNSSLRKGARVVERDRMSTITRELSYTEPQDGNNVKLTLIASYQQQAERALADDVEWIRLQQEKEMARDGWLEDNKEDINSRDWVKYPLSLAARGAMVVVDMEGRVLACANYPTYDLNALVAREEESTQILTDPRNVLMNYAIHARGTPGSIFKMVAGFGALIEGELTPSETISDGGYYMKYNQDKSTAPKCWIAQNYISDHADQTIVEGLANSCNYFFYELGSRLGEDRLYRYAALFGLTSKTGIDLPGELRSVVGTQNTLYDPTSPVGESTQDTARPIIVFNSVKKHLRACGASYNIEYDDERLSRCVKRLMDMAVNYDQGDEGKIWLEQMRTILMEELNMTKEMVYTQAIIGDTYNYLNDIKWGGGETIMTAVGQSVTYLTPAAVARYVAAVANGGNVYNLMLVDSITSPEGDILSQRTPTLSNVIDGAETYKSYIHAGMKGVVDDGGTAKKYFDGFNYIDDMAAKTGTAEVTTIDLENNSWFVAFAPFEKPEIAIAVFIPSGWSGSRSAYAVKDFLTWYMDQKTLRNTDAVLPSGNTLAP